MKRLGLVILLWGGCDVRAPAEADASSVEQRSDASPVQEAALLDAAIERMDGSLRAASMHDASAVQAPLRPGDAACTQEHVACRDLQPIDVRGMSPLGPLHATGIAVSYWRGFMYGTGLSVRLEVGADTVELYVPINTTSSDILDEQCLPGTYRSDAPVGSGRSLSASFELCDRNVELHNVALRVDRHDRPANVVLEKETPVHFVGTLVVRDPGWSLELSFSLEHSCGVWTEL